MILDLMPYMVFGFIVGAAYLQWRAFKEGLKESRKRIEEGRNKHRWL